MHVYEESHRGIVPMNHSNKDGTSLAESEEGRLRIKENTFSFDTYGTGQLVSLPRSPTTVSRVGTVDYAGEIILLSLVPAIRCGIHI
jgi:hypothetical protein